MRFNWWEMVGISFIGALLVSNIAWAADLPSALRQAVESDPRVLSARATYQAKQVEAEGAYSVYLPIVRGTGSAGSSKSSDPLTRDGSKRVYGLELEQPIPLFGRESARVELARVAVKIEAAEVNRVEQTVLAEVLEAILDTAARKEALALRERLAVNLSEQSAAVRETITGGGMKATEQRLILSRVAQSVALRARAAAELAAAEAKLQRMLPGIPPPLLDTHLLRRWWTGTLSLEAVQETALQAAPTLLKARALAEQATAEHTVARTDLWPRLSLTMQGQKGSFGAASADSNSIFLGFSAPLYEGGSSLSRVDSAVHRSNAARENAAQEQRMVTQRISEAWAHWRASEAMALAWRESEQQDEELIHLTEQQLAGGAATQLVLLRAMQTWLETVLQGVDYRSQRDVAWVRLLLESGVLTLASLEHKQDK